MLAGRGTSRVVELLPMLGGVAPTGELVRAGISEKSVQRAASAGIIERICHGWYSMPGGDPRPIQLIRAGGSLGCASGAAFHGLWEPPETGLHLSVPHGANVPRHPVSPIAGVTHWGHPASRDDSHGVLPLVACLAQVLNCMPADFAFAMLESALRNKRITAVELRALQLGATKAAASLIDHATALADSGTESLFRYRCLCLGIVGRSQVHVAGVGRVDFVIGDRLLVEIDSEAFHGSPSQRRRDLGRDAIAAGLGFVVLHFDYWQIMWDWDTVRSTVLAVVARGDHLSRR